MEKSQPRGPIQTTSKIIAKLPYRKILILRVAEQAVLRLNMPANRMYQVNVFV